MKLLLPGGGMVAVPELDPPFDPTGFVAQGAVVLPDEAEWVPLPTDDRTIYQRLAAVKRALPPIPKADVNEEQHFKFRGIERILAAAGPLFDLHGVIPFPRVKETKRWITERGRDAKPWQHYSIKVRYHFYGEAGDSVFAEVVGEGLDNADKGLSKAMTMAYKTALIQVLNIADPEEQDPDATKPADEPTPRRNQARGRNRNRGGSGSDDPPPADDDPPLKPWDEALAERTTPEHAAAVAELVRRIKAIGDPGSMAAIRDQFLSEFGDPGSIEPTTLPRAQEWVDTILAPENPPAPPEGSENATQAPIQPEQEPSGGGERPEHANQGAPAACATCGAPATRDGWCAEHEPF